MKNIYLFLNKQILGHTLVINKFVVLERTAQDKVFCKVSLDKPYGAYVETIDDIQKLVEHSFITAGLNISFSLK